MLHGRFDTKWRRWESNPGPKITRSRVYVRIRQFASFPVAPAGGLSRNLFTCLLLPARPATRRSAIQLVDALRRVLEDPSVGRRSVLFRQRARSRYRSQSYRARVFTWACAPRYATTSPSSPSKPIAPFVCGARCERCRRDRPGSPHPHRQPKARARFVNAPLLRRGLVVTSASDGAAAPLRLLASLTPAVDLPLARFAQPKGSRYWAAPT